MRYFQSFPSHIISTLIWKISHKNDSFDELRVLYSNDFTSLSINFGISREIDKFQF